MSLGERISRQRKNRGMSQEKLAELVGVSRQAVSKWEAGQSAPSTENLCKLADILGISVDSLLDSEKPEDCKAKSLENRRAEWKGRIGAALGILAGYLALYLLGRIGSGYGETSSLTGWLFGVDVRQLPYLYGWLLTQKLFWFSAIFSALPSLWGKYRFSCTTLAAFALGLLLGEGLGAYPAGAPYGQSHYGWAIWAGIFLFSIPMGIILEKMAGRRRPLSAKGLGIWCAAAIGGVAAVLLLVLGSIPHAYGSC